MELFKNPNFDFLGKKWPFIIVSLALVAAGMTSLFLHGGPRYGIDFKGGALMYLKFAEMPPLDDIRSALSSQIEGEISVQEIVGSNEIMVNTEMKSDKELADARHLMVTTLSERFGDTGGKPDFNNAGQQLIASELRDPLQRSGAGLPDDELAALAERMREFRDTPPRSGLIKNFDVLAEVEGVTPEVLAAVKETFGLAPFAIRSVEVVGPKIGEELRGQAIMATLLALGGMLVYIAFRFEWIYGVAAVLAVFHDTVITIGLFFPDGQGDFAYCCSGVADPGRLFDERHDCCF